jgi:hypothetical protein
LMYVVTNFIEKQLTKIYSKWFVLKKEKMCYYTSSLNH